MPSIGAAENAACFPILFSWENTYVDKHEPVEAPLIPYSLAARDIGHVSSPTHVPFGAWRSVDHSQHGFFTESFFDEVAIAAGQDPYEYRAARLAHKPRQLAVLRKAAEAADWGSPLGKGQGRGISFQECFGSIVAQVVEVTIVDGQTQVDRVVAAVDPGIAISPDGLSAQIILTGITAGALILGAVALWGLASASRRDASVKRCKGRRHSS
jgi:isoquinoline 1-oxidoreductase beta subunit